jgi:hypothetical protein
MVFTPSGHTPWLKRTAEWALTYASTCCERLLQVGDPRRQLHLQLHDPGSYAHPGTQLGGVEGLVT